jgi:predicted 3-demethylubiquinone-9 3-methyltransferase (glyoxalase superfamily)
MHPPIQKITPFLWFDHQAEDAMQFYVDLFKDSEIHQITRYQDGPLAGKVLTGEFQLEGQRFMALDGGPEFAFTPAVSFFVHCDTPEEVDRLYSALIDDGQPLMPLRAYPFSEKYASVTDRFGVTWQLNHSPQEQKISPFLMFTGDQSGKDQEALQRYAGLFEDSAIQPTQLYDEGKGHAELTKGWTKFTLAGQSFMALNDKRNHDFTFSGAISFFVDCADQAEVDRLWEALGKDGDIMDCGWLADSYGVTWQIIPSALGRMLSDSDPEKAQRAMDAMLKMKKIEIDELKRALEAVG